VHVLVLVIVIVIVIEAVSHAPNSLSSISIDISQQYLLAVLDTLNRDYEHEHDGVETKYTKTARTGIWMR
jgi:hypothetical protein